MTDSPQTSQNGCCMLQFIPAKAVEKRDTNKHFRSEEAGSITSLTLTHQKPRPGSATWAPSELPLVMVVSCLWPQSNKALIQGRGVPSVVRGFAPAACAAVMGGAVFSPLHRPEETEVQAGILGGRIWLWGSVLLLATLRLRAVSREPQHAFFTQVFGVLGVLTGLSLSENQPPEHAVLSPLYLCFGDASSCCPLLPLAVALPFPHSRCSNRLTFVFNFLRQTSNTAHMS